MLKGEEKVADREFLLTLEGWVEYHGLSNSTKRAIRECIKTVDGEMCGRNILNAEKVIEELVGFEPQKDDQGNIIPCKCF
jgi:hypothetical protein